MPRPRSVSPENRSIKHVELDEGDWVKLKTKLDYGESSDLYDATYRSNVGTGDRATQRVMQMGRFNIDRLLIYIHSWSFMDDKNQPITLSAEAVRRLDTDTSLAIHDAISVIEAENARTEEVSKKPQPAVAGSNNSSDESSHTTPVSITSLARSE